MLGAMPDELFRATHFHNSAPNSNIEGHMPLFYSHIGAGHKGIKPLMCKHNVVYDLLTLASYKFPPCAGGHSGFGTKNAGKVIGGMVADAFCNFSDFQIGVSQVFFCLTNAEFSD